MLAWPCQGGTSRSSQAPLLRPNQAVVNQAAEEVPSGGDLVHVLAPVDLFSSLGELPCVGLEKTARQRYNAE